MVYIFRLTLFFFFFFLLFFNSFHPSRFVHSGFRPDYPTDWSRLCVKWNSLQSILILFSRAKRMGGGGKQNKMVEASDPSRLGWAPFNIPPESNSMLLDGENRDRSSAVSFTTKTSRRNNGRQGRKKQSMIHCIRLSKRDPAEDGSFLRPTIQQFTAAPIINMD